MGAWLSVSTTSEQTDSSSDGGVLENPKLPCAPPCMESIVMNDVVITFDSSTTSAPVLQNFAPLESWTAKMSQLIVSHHINVQSVTVLNVYMFGSRAGFVLLEADAYMQKKTDEAPHKLPGAVLLRGESVAVLPWRETSTDSVEVLLISQPRLATGKLMTEAPAGMIDPGGTCTGTAFKELKEETGMVINESQLTLLEANVVLSPGLCDEEISLYAYRIPIDFDVSTVATDQLGENGEVITNVRLVDIENINQENSDAKTMLLVQSARSRGLFAHSHPDSESPPRRSRSAPVDFGTLTSRLDETS